MRRPAVFLATAFLAGCSLVFCGVISSLPLLVSCLLASCLLCILVRLKGLRCGQLTKALSLMVTFLVLGMLRTHFYMENSPSVPEADKSQGVEWKGVVSSDPEWQARGQGRGSTQFTVIFDSGELVRVFVPGDYREALECGDIASVKGVIREGRRGRYISAWRVWKAESGSMKGLVSFKRKLYRVRRRAATMLEAGIGAFPDQAGILKALVLGYRGGVSRSTRELFIATGSLHIFAISGLHRPNRD